MKEQLKRLQKILAEHGIASRRKAEVLISEGQVKINGKTASLGSKAFEHDEITVQGKLISKKVTFVYYAFNKPVGYVVSAKKQGDAKIIFDIIQTKERVFPVGRLDKDSEGLLILTNDGDFAQNIAHPSHDTEKTYLVTLDRAIKTSDMRKIEKGIQLADESGEVYSTQGTKLKAQQSPKKVLVTIKIGKYHVIRKMFGHFGYAVQKLQRIALGSLRLGSLAPGEMRPLTNEEIQELHGFRK